MAGTSRKRQNIDDMAEPGDAKGIGGSQRSGASKASGARGGAGGRQNTAGGRNGGGTKNSGSAGSRRSTSDSKRFSAARKRAEELPAQEHSFMGTEVAIIVTFAISVLLFLSNFGVCGVAGAACRRVMLGFFGSVGYLAPILLFVGTCFYLSNQGNIRAVLKMAAVAAVLLSFCGLSQMLFGGGLKEGWKLTEYYAQSGASGSGGGFIGGLLVTLLAGSLGNVGAYVVLFVLLAIGAVFITERSLVNLVKRGSGKAYEYAREDMSRRRELYEERRDEKRRLREEQRVRGVNLDATRLTDGVLMREFAGGNLDRTVSGPDMEEEYGKAPDRTEQEERPQNPADVFRGKINPPCQGSYETEYDPEYGSEYDPEYRSGDDEFRGEEVEEAPEAERSPREEEAAPVQGASRDIGRSFGDDTGSDRLLKTLYVRRDVRTFEEFSGAERKNAASAGFTVVRTAERDDEAGPAVPWSGGGGPDEVRRSRPDSLSGASGPDRMAAERGLSGGRPFERGSRYDEAENSMEYEGDAFIEEDYEGFADIRPEDELSMDSISSSIPVRDSGRSRETAENREKGYQNTAQARESGPAQAADAQRGYYKAMETAEDGADYDSFFIPEEPKTIVTSSGKVIETDTEMVRKTLEKKREERKSLPDSELTVPEQIEKKAVVEKETRKEYVFPPLDLLKRGERSTSFSDREYRETAIKLQQTLQNFGVGVTVTNISCGPSVTRYELHPEQGVKVSKIVSLADDIKLSLAAADIRIEAPIPGKSAVGIEVPNKENQVVLLRDLLESEDFKRHSSHMAFAVGKDIGGQVVVTDIAKMPHLLIAGATGSGKSVCINTLIMSVIYKARPEDVKLIMVDPKVVELSVYNGIPHLLIPVVTDPKKASGALNWAVGEMMDRYSKFARYNVRDLKGYNDKIKKIGDIEDRDKPQKLPQIIIIVDELADLMMVAPGEVEDAICRLAQLARAAGIHLVIATQRPSVNVITGLIKANVPSRIAFSVSSGVDSRTIIDMNGAEKLLGKGDMLFYPSGYQKPQRVQGAFVSDQEVSRVVEFLTEQGLTAEYSPDVQSKISSGALGEGGSGKGEQDAYFVQAGRFIIEKDKASIGMLQRMFKIGFNRAARIMDQLAEAGVVGEEEGTKPRKILMSMEQFENMLEEG